MQNLELIRAFLQQATEQGSRSTVLKPLGWMMAILVAATISAFSFSAPIWLGVLFAVFCGLTMFLYLFSYVYFMFKDKDALRSETYSIQKLAIEKGFVGDSIKGVFELKTAAAIKQLQESSGDASEEKR